MTEIAFWDSNDIAYQGAWFYVGVLEDALDKAIEYLIANGMYRAIDEINKILDEVNEHVYTPEEKGDGV